MHLPQKKYNIYKPYHDKAWKSNLYQSYNCSLLPQMCRSPCELQPDLLIVVSAPIAVSWHPALCCVDFQPQIFELQSSTLWTSAGCPDPLQQKKRMVNPLLTYIQSSIRVYTPKSLKLDVLIFQYMILFSLLKIQLQQHCLNTRWRKDTVSCYLHFKKYRKLEPNDMLLFSSFWLQCKCASMVYHILNW